MPIFKICSDSKVLQLKKTSFCNEKELQKFVERNLLELFNIQFVASEFIIGQKYAGRIDTLGLDENGCPVIIEYKWTESENVINQGLFYLDWLMDHKGDFELAVQKSLGMDVKVNWDAPRLILIAQSFSKYDSYAVNRIGENIELKVYRLYEDNLFYIDDVTRIDASMERDTSKKGEGQSTKRSADTYNLDEHLNGKSDYIVELFSELDEHIHALGDNIIRKILKKYIGYQTTRNFCELIVQSKSIKVHIDIEYNQLCDPRGMAEDVSSVGRWATGPTRVYVHLLEDIQYVMGLIRQSYERTL